MMPSSWEHNDCRVIFNALKSQLVILIGSNLAMLMYRSQMAASLLGCLAILLLVGVASAQSGMTLGLRFVANSDRSCGGAEDYDVPTYYTSAQYNLEVSIIPTDGRLQSQLPYSGITDWDWPVGLTIAAGWASTPDGVFQPSVEVTNQLQLDYLVTWAQIRDDSIWRATNRPPVLTPPLSYNFSFIIPESAADSFLCFTAEWDHLEYGHLNTKEPICAKVMAPCSEVSQSVIRRTFVYNAFLQRDYSSAVADADSFMSLGWHDLEGLIWAGLSAKALERYDDAIRFLDTLYQWHHTIVIPSEGGVGPETEAGYAAYQRYRNQLLDLQTRQSNKQQKR